VKIARPAWISRGRRSCPAAWKLTRSISSEAPDPEIETHLAACPSCAAEYAALRQLVTDAQRLATPPGMSNESRAAISARLFTTAPEPKRRPTALARRTIALAAVAAGVVLAIVGVTVSDRRGVPEPRASVTRMAGSPSRASIRAIGNARFLRAQPPPDEIVRLEDGRIELDVVPLATGERFRVVTDNGEVEVRGTSFEVLAFHRTLRSVSVSRGRVEVRSDGGLAVLDAGDRWEQAAPSSPAPSVVETPRARHAPGSRPPARQQASAAESALFDRAWSSLRAGNAEEAAETFAELERRAKGRAIEEDALYWRAVSVARSKDSATAGLLFREHLRRFPLSSRRGEASVALGWILLDAGDVNDARRAFEQAISDPASSVRDSAAEGIRRTTAR
jgi:FecR-like protein/tetratricopeptide repeat protein